MAYTKQYSKTTWVNNEAPAINATNLNKIEKGIDDVDSGLVEVEQTLTVRMDALEQDVSENTNDITNAENAIAMLDAGSLSAIGSALGDTPVSKGDGTWAWMSRGYVTPQMFGAVGDGVTDDTEAMQNAFSNDKPLYIPKGTYVIKAGLTVSEHKVVIGENQLYSRLKFIDVQDNAITASGDFIHFENLSIHSDSFDYSVRGTSNEYRCISATNLHYSTFDNMRVVGFNYGFYLSQSWSNSFKNMFVLCCNFGVYGANEFNQILFSHCVLHTCKTAAWIQGGRTVVFNVCDIEQNDLGIAVRNISDVRITACYFELNTKCIDIDWANNAVPICTIKDCSIYVGADSVGVIFYHMAESGRLIVENNFFKSADLGSTIIPIFTPLNNTTKVVPIMIENKIDGNYSTGITNYVDYNYMPIAVAVSDFITLNSGYTLVDFAVYRMGRHVYGNFTIQKTSAFVSGSNTVGVLKAKYIPYTNINTYGALTSDRWAQNTNNLCYVFLSPTAMDVKNGDGTSTFAKVIINYTTKEQ